MINGRDKDAESPRCGQHVWKSTSCESFKIFSHDETEVDVSEIRGFSFCLRVYPVIINFQNESTVFNAAFLNTILTHTLAVNDLKGKDCRLQTKAAAGDASDPCDVRGSQRISCS